MKFAIQFIIFFANTGTTKLIKKSIYKYIIDKNIPLVFVAWIGFVFSTKVMRSDQEEDRQGFLFWLQLLTFLKKTLRLLVQPSYLGPLNSRLEVVGNIFYHFFCILQHIQYFKQIF